MRSQGSASQGQGSGFEEIAAIKMFHVEYIFLQKKQSSTNSWCFCINLLAVGCWLLAVGC